MQTHEGNEPPGAASDYREQAVQIGIFGVGDVTPDPHTGVAPTEHERIKAIMRIAQHAEEVGLDVFATGEHHNPPFVPSSPTTMLGYLAARTSRIILSMSTTLITTNDPAKIAVDETPLTVGSPQQVIEKTLTFRESFGSYQRQLFLIDHAGLPLKTVLEQLDLLGSEVVPVLRKEVEALRPAGAPDAPTFASRKAARQSLAEATVGINHQVVGRGTDVAP